MLKWSHTLLYNLWKCWWRAYIFCEKCRTQGQPIKHRDLSFYLWFVNQVHWTGHKLCSSHTQTRNTAGWKSGISAAGWPELGGRSPFSQEDGHVCSLPTILSFPEYIFFSKPGFIQETGFLILVLVNIFMCNFWENSEESKSMINKRERGMLKVSHDSRYHKGAGGSWNTLKCCLFVYICINLQAQTLGSAWGMETSFWAILGPIITSHKSKFQLDLSFICLTLTISQSQTPYIQWKKIKRKKF